MIQLHLYSTSHCHLCELAESLLKSLAMHYAVIWQTFDIADNEDLLARYEVTIPVISDPNTNNEVCWPFTAEDIIKKFKLNLR